MHWHLFRIFNIISHFSHYKMLGVNCNVLLSYHYWTVLHLNFFTTTSSFTKWNVKKNITFKMKIPNLLNVLMQKNQYVSSLFEKNWKFNSFHFHSSSLLLLGSALLSWISFSLLLFSPQFCQITLSSLLSMAFDRQQFLKPLTTDSGNILSQEVRIHWYGRLTEGFLIFVTDVNRYESGFRTEAEARIRFSEVVIKRLINNHINGL